MPKKKFMFTESADLANFNYKGIYVSLTIDTRKWTVTKRDEAAIQKSTTNFKSCRLY